MKVLLLCSTLVLIASLSVKAVPVGGVEGDEEDGVYDDLTEEGYMRVPKAALIPFPRTGRSSEAGEITNQNPSPGDIKTKKDAYSRRLLRSTAGSDNRAYSRRLIRSGANQSFNRRLLRSPAPTFARRILRSSGRDVANLAFNRRLIRSGGGSDSSFRRRLLRSGMAFNRRLLRSDPMMSFKRRIFKKSDPDVEVQAPVKRQSLIPFPRTGKRSGGAPGAPADGDAEVPETLFQSMDSYVYPLEDPELELLTDTDDAEDIDLDNISPGAFDEQKMTVENGPEY